MTALPTSWPLTVQHANIHSLVKTAQSAQVILQDLIVHSARMDGLPLILDVPPALNTSLDTIASLVKMVGPVPLAPFAQKILLVQTAKIAKITGRVNAAISALQTIYPAIALPVLQDIPGMIVWLT